MARINPKYPVHAAGIVFGVLTVAALASTLTCYYTTNMQEVMTNEGAISLTVALSVISAIIAVALLAQKEWYTHISKLEFTIKNNLLTSARFVDPETGAILKEIAITRDLKNNKVTSIGFNNQEHWVPNDPDETKNKIIATMRDLNKGVPLSEDAVDIIARNVSHIIYYSVVNDNMATSCNINRFNGSIVGTIQNELLDNGYSWSTTLTVSAERKHETQTTV